MIKDTFLHNRKTYATGLVRPKTTALFFDKIWYPSDLPEYEKIPKSIIYKEKKIPKSELVRVKRQIRENIVDKKDYLFQSTNMGVENNAEENDFTIAETGDFEKYVLYDNTVKSLIEKITNPLISISPFMRMNYDGPLELSFSLIGNVPEYAYLSSYYRNTGIRAAVHRLRYVDHIDIVPIFFDYTDYEKYLINEEISRFNLIDEAHREGLKRAFSGGTSSADIIEACIDAVPMIVEENLSWEQVKEIRSDKESQQKLSRFLFWAHKDFDGKTSSEIAELLYMEIDDYEFALKKHGMSTIIGGFTTLLSGGATMLSAISDVSKGLAPACLTISAGLIAFSSSQAIELLECKRNPIAFMYDVIKEADK